MKIASVQFDLKQTWPDEFWARVENLCAEAKDHGADLILFPEYFSVSLLLAHHDSNFKKALRGFASIAADFHKRLQKLSKSHNMAIVAGSVPFVSGRQLLNRSFIYLPGKKPLHQDKHHMTRFEDEEWQVSGGKNQVTQFKWRGATFGVAICFDVEFPRYVEKLVQKNVDIILVPSCTDDVHGYWRVRHCAEARAIESQSYSVVSYTVGGDPRFSEIYPHWGQAAFLGPCDVGFAEGGCLLEGSANQEGVYIASLDLKALREVRKRGTVLNRQQLRK